MMSDLTREKFAQQVIDLVRSRFPLVKVARSDRPFSLKINGRAASLENLYRMFKLSPDDLKRQVERWAVELLRDAEGTPDRFADYEQISDRLLPMLVANDTGEVSHSGVLAQPLVDGLSVTYVLDGDRTIAYLPNEILSRWNRTIDEVHDTAITNLVSRSQSLQAHAAQDDDGRVNLILFQTLDGFDSTRLLLPTLHARLRDMLGSPFAAAIPNRDILLCFRADSGTVNRLRSQVANDYQTMPHQVTQNLFLVTPDGIAPYASSSTE